jgi:hypothetical protein
MRSRDCEPFAIGRDLQFAMEVGMVTHALPGHRILFGLENVARDSRGDAESDSIRREWRIHVQSKLRWRFRT